VRSFFFFFFFFFFFSPVPCLLSRRYLRECAKLRTVYETMLDQRLVDRNAGKEFPSDFLSTLLQLLDDKTYTREECIDQVLLTSALSFLSFFLFLSFILSFFARRLTFFPFIPSSSLFGRLPRSWQRALTRLPLL
jgi:hypothetical protein